MDRSEIDSALNEVALLFSDRRVNLFEITVTGVEENLLRLEGRVLEESNCEVLLAHLARRFPHLRIDSDGIAVARKPDPRLLYVSTNLAGFYAEPSFASRLVSQLFNGSVQEVLQEQADWAFARQSDGYLGWVYLPHLSLSVPSSAIHLVSAPVGLLREQPLDVAALVTRLPGGTRVSINEEIEEWANIELVGGTSGWLPRSSLRSLDALPNEPASRRQILAADAAQMIGVPYLEGGCSALGFNSAGFTQLLYRLIGETLPRDADMQWDAGRPAKTPFEPGDLLFFGENGEPPRITHVGMSLGGWRMIHASRSRNGVYIDEVQSAPHLRESYLFTASFF